MEKDRLLRLYNHYTGEERDEFEDILDENEAHITIYKHSPLLWEMIFLRDVYEELQKELPAIKKKVIAKAIRELKEEYELSEMNNLRMKIYRLGMILGDDPSLKCIHIDRKMKNEFKDYIKDAFKQNRVKWHWWNNLEWGL